MGRKLLILVVLIGSFSLGCQSTVTALKKTPPEKFVEVIPDDPKTNVKELLEASGVDYVCKELYFGKGSSKNRKACFVKAPPADMYEKMEVKMSDLPSAILKDTGRNAILVGELAIMWITSGGYISQ
jgi:hypothetical protein